MTTRWRRFWFDDLAPVSPVQRFVFYGALLALAVRQSGSPFTSLGEYRQTDDRLHQTFGILDWLGVGHVDPTLLEVVIVGVTIAWVAAALGLWGRWPAVATVLGAGFLHGVFFGSNAFNHYWFLPLYAMAAMAVAVPQRSLLDVVRRRPPSEPSRQRQRPVGATGLPRKLALVGAVAFYFAAGMSKLTTAGLDWLSGDTIHYFAGELGSDRLLGSVFADRPALATAGAVGTMVLELGAPLVLVSRWLRLPFYAGWIGMHVTIRFTMGPWYLTNIVVILTLLVEWPAVLALARRGWDRLRSGTAPDPTDPTAAPSSTTTGVGPRRERLAAGLATAVLAGLGVSAALTVFWWPLTSVYMYSPHYSDDGVRSGHPASTFEDPVGAQEIARAYRAEDASNESVEHLLFRSGLRLTGSTGAPLVLDDAPGVASWKEWVLVHAGPAILDDLATSTIGAPEHDATDPDRPAQRLLSDYLPVFLDHAADEGIDVDRFDRLELTYELARGVLVLAAVDLG